MSFSAVQIYHLSHIRLDALFFLRALKFQPCFLNWDAEIKKLVSFGMSRHAYPKNGCADYLKSMYQYLIVQSDMRRSFSIHCVTKTWVLSFIVFQCFLVLWILLQWVVLEVSSYLVWCKFLFSSHAWSMGKQNIRDSLRNLKSRVTLLWKSEAKTEKHTYKQRNEASRQMKNQRESTLTTITNSF